MKKLMKKSTKVKILGVLIFVSVLLISFNNYTPYGISYMTPSLDCRDTLKPLYNWKGVASKESVESVRICYDTSSNKPFTGVLVERFSNGNKKIERSYVGGQFSGPITKWDETGKLISKNIVDFSPAKKIVHLQ